MEFLMLGCLEVVYARLEGHFARFRAFARSILRRLFAGHAVALRATSATTAATTLAATSFFLRLLRRPARLVALGRFSFEDFGQRIFIEEKIGLINRFWSLPLSRYVPLTMLAVWRRRTSLIAHLRLARRTFPIAIPAALATTVPLAATILVTTTVSAATSLSPSTLRLARRRAALLR